MTLRTASTKIGTEHGTKMPKRAGTKFTIAWKMRARCAAQRRPRRPTPCRVSRTGEMRVEHAEDRRLLVEMVVVVRDLLCRKRKRSSTPGSVNSCGSIPEAWIAGMRVAYIQTHMTSVQQTRTRAGVRIESMLMVLEGVEHPHLAADRAIEVSVGPGFVYERSATTVDVVVESMPTMIERNSNRFAIAASSIAGFSVCERSSKKSNGVPISRGSPSRVSVRSTVLPRCGRCARRCSRAGTIRLGHIGVVGRLASHVFEIALHSTVVGALRAIRVVHDDNPWASAASCARDKASAARRHHHAWREVAPHRTPPKFSLPA